MAIEVWILTDCAILQAVISQDMYIHLSSTVPSEGVLCPEEEVIFTCVIRGSSIIAWKSDEYIGVNQLLEFSIADEIGANHNSSKLNVVAHAILVNKTNDGRVMVLKSQLHITISNAFIDFSVTCDSVQGDDYGKNTSSFQVIAPLGEPQATTVYLTEDAMARCTVHVSWTLPANVTNDDVMYFVVLIDGMIERIVNVTNKPLISTYFSICNCAPHTVNVGAVNHCDIMGQSSPSIRVKSERLEDDCDPNGINNPERECPSTLEITIALILLTIVIFIILSIMLPVCACIITYNLRSNSFHRSITSANINNNKIPEPADTKL